MCVVGLMDGPQAVEAVRLQLAQDQELRARLLGVAVVAAVPPPRPVLEPQVPARR